MSVKFSFLTSASGAELVAVSDLLGGDVEPAQPLGFVRAGPERSVVLPEAADLVAARQSSMFAFTAAARASGSL